MSYLNEWLELRPATAMDGDQILRIYESEEFDGDISVIYTRRPNPYLSFLKRTFLLIEPHKLH